MPDTKRLLLVNPTADAWRVDGRRAPRTATRLFRYSMLSSLAVAAAAPPWVETRIVDEETEPLDFGTPADLVGLSFMTFNAPRAYAIADRFRRERGLPVIMGGFHPTFMPQEALRHADAVCAGEAEANLPRMMADFAAGRLGGIYRDGPADLSRLNPPDRRLLRRGLYAPVDAVQATRGCPQRCTFCSIAAFHEGRFRARPVAAVVEELRTLGPRILFLDDNLAADRDHALELFAAMAPLRRRWYSQCAVGIAFDDVLLRAAVRSGCRGLFIGFESLEQDNLAAWGKRDNRAADYGRAIRRLHEAGVGVVAAIVFGHDADTPAVFDRTLAFLDDARADALQATILTPFPGTPLHAQMEREGRIRDRDWSRYDFGHVVFEPRGMSAQQLRRGHDRVLERFYAPRAIRRRLWRAFGDLGFAQVVTGVAPLNLGYRFRLRANGTIGGRVECSLAVRSLEPTPAAVRGRQRATDA